MNETIMNLSEYLFIIMIITISLVSWILFIYVLRNKKNNEVHLKILQSLIHRFRPTLGIEKNLDLILSDLQEIVEAPNYSFYIYNESNNQYTLKAIRQLTNDTKIAPSYSGLLPYQKEKFDPPLAITKENFPSKTSFIKEGEVPLLTIPIKGEKGIIRIGPIHTLPRKVIKELDRLGNVLDVPLMNLMEEEDKRRNYEVLETSAKAVKFINQLYVHDVEYFKLLIQTCVKTLLPLNCLLIQSNPSYQQVPYSSGMNKKTIQNIKENKSIHTKIKELMDEKPFKIITNTNINHKKLKEMLLMNVGDYAALAQFTLSSYHYTFVLSFKRELDEVEKTRSQVIKSLLVNIQQFIKIKQGNKSVSASYIELLKSLADLIDQMSPYTIGYSKLMSSYSMTIAKHMGLNEYQIRSIGLAAYLSNIGIIGLSDGLLNKEGKYSEEEYEQMKLHSEVGAAIIENTIAEEEVALYIRHHHERMDGNGYPAKLVGNDIPVGARIIAVVQTFLAKINGRSYRDPLPFDEAIKLLRNASSSQLDSNIVTIFINWYEKKRLERKGINKAVGNCWDLCQTPSYICSQCPAYKKISKNCWEYESNNCQAHGKSCKTCFVYTEAMSRIANLK